MLCLAIGIIVGTIAFTVRKIVGLLEVAKYSAFEVAEMQSPALGFLTFCVINILYAVISCLTVLLTGVRDLASS